MKLQEAVAKVKKNGTLLEAILNSLDQEDRDYLIYLLKDTNTSCSTISKALDHEGYAISERTLQKERKKLVTKENG